MRVNRIWTVPVRPQTACLLMALAVSLPLWSLSANADHDERSGSERCLDGGEFLMGSNRHYPEEREERMVRVHSFCIDIFEVTNAQFAEFVAATAYVTLAERGPAKSDYPQAPPEYFRPGSAVFVMPDGNRAPAAMSWWQFKEQAYWRRPAGKGSSVDGLEEHPVVHVAYEDALAYAQWRGRDLPTEAEWEFAARGGGNGTEFAWGDERAPGGVEQANTWQGDFPVRNKALDAYRGTAPVGSFPANGYGLHDMIGNVWEWTRSSAPRRDSARMQQRVIKGGSFLCAPNYCARFRPAARQAQDAGLGTSHVGFRTVRRIAPPESD